MIFRQGRESLLCNSPALTFMLKVIITDLQQVLIIPENNQVFSIGKQLMKILFIIGDQETTTTEYIKDAHGEAIFYKRTAQVKVDF